MLIGEDWRIMQNFHFTITEFFKGELMDKIQLLQERKGKIICAGEKIRTQIKALIDIDSFVELSAFSFSKNEFYCEDAAGEGVVTGFATINDAPY